MTITFEEFERRCDEHGLAWMLYCQYTANCSRDDEGRALRETIRDLDSRIARLERKV